MPLKKKKISELEEAQDMRGFYTIGYRIVNGVKTSLKFGLEKVQTAYENMVALKNDALAAIRDIRSLEATVESNEETREISEAQRVSAEQVRVQEYGGVINELNTAKQSSVSQTALAKKATDDANAATQSSINQTALAKSATDNANSAAGSVNAAKEAATADGANAAKSASEEQTVLAKTATDNANTAANTANLKATLAGEKAALADAAAQAANEAATGVETKVKTAIDKLVADAPDALDTLQELATALGNDPNFATTMTNELVKKLNKTDIVNDLVSGGAGKVLSAEQGKILKTSFDNHNHSGIYEPIFSKNTAFNKNFGTAAGTVCEGNDLRLSDSRTPKAHTHPATEVSGDEDHRFVSDAEKNIWDSKAEGNHNHDSIYSSVNHEHQASDIQETTDKKVMTAEERNILSTLGTNFAKSDFSNVITKSLSQNGYYKFPDGLLIQWGYFSGGVSNAQSIRFPLSFKSCFSLAFSSTTDNTNNSIWSVNYAAIYASYFTVYRRYADAGTIANSSQSFRWIAIGTWK